MRRWPRETVNTQHPSKRQSGLESSSAPKHRAAPAPCWGVPVPIPTKECHELSLIHARKHWSDPSFQMSQPILPDAIGVSFVKHKHSRFLRLKSWSRYMVYLLSSKPKAYLIQYLHFYNCFRNGNAQRQAIYFLREYNGNLEVCTDGHLSLGLTTITQDFKDPHLELPWSEYSEAILSYPSNGQRQIGLGTTNTQNSFGTFQFTHCLHQLGTIYTIHLRSCYSGSLLPIMPKQSNYQHSSHQDIKLV